MLHPGVFDELRKSTFIQDHNHNIKGPHNQIKGFVIRPNQHKI